MNLTFITPVDELKPYIIKFWLVRNNNGFINHGTLVAPNAKPKIIISFKNEISATDHKKSDRCKEGDICFIGVRDVPVILKSGVGETGSIGVEFRTEGAYRIFREPMSQLTNNLFSISDIYGNQGRILIEQVGNEDDPIKKINIVQNFLLKRLRKGGRDNRIYDCSVSLLHGLSSVKELEKKTGYSSRYLAMLFKEYLGIPPKTLISIYRFQKFYKSANSLDLPGSTIASAYDLYYDQSHFIREFKRYTGFTPLQYSRFNNDFGKIF